MEVGPAAEAADLTVRWRSEEWRAEVDSWIQSQLDDVGITAAGAGEQVRLKPWSTHLVVPTNEGRYWFKENCPALRFEAGLVESLRRLVPGRVLEPLAIDLDRGWMLTPDGGPTLDRAAADDVFGRILAEYGVLQRALVAYQAELTTTGLPVVTAGGAADHFECQLRELAGLPADHPLHIGQEVIARAVKHRGVIVDAAEQLAAIPLPNSLQHNDLQPTNAFVPREEDLRFFDFGDAIWSHPFCVLNVVRFRMAEAWDCAIEDPRIRRFIDGYLDGWTDWAPIRDLRGLVGPAIVVARLHRYNSWHQLIPYMPADELRGRAGYAEAVIPTSPAR